MPRKGPKGTIRQAIAKVQKMLSESEEDKTEMRDTLRRLEAHITSLRVLKIQMESLLVEDIVGEI